MQRPDANEELSKRITQMLRAQPLERAPATLIARVQDRIAEQREGTRRGTAPWWRQSLVHWPLAARFAFIATSLACAALLTYVVAPDASAWASEASGGVLARLGGAMHGVSALLGLLTRLSRHALDAVLIVYGVLFGLLALAYVLLHGRAPTRGIQSS
jgi:hypothetical protein